MSKNEICEYFDIKNSNSKNKQVWMPYEYMEKYYNKHNISHNERDKEDILVCFSTTDPRRNFDIVSINGTKINYCDIYDIESFNKLSDIILSAYWDMKQDEKDYNLLHYDVVISEDFEKMEKIFLYENYINEYGVVDNIVKNSIVIKDDIINVKYDINNVIKNHVFKSGGFELLKLYRKYEINNKIECK